MSDAGRPGTNPADPAAAPLQALAAALKDLRQRSGTTLAALAEKIGKSKTALSAATNGKDLPSWPLTLAITHACGGNEDSIKQLWIAAATSEGRRIPAGVISGPPPDPSNAKDAGEFAALLDELRQWAGLSFETLNKRAEGFNALPSSSAHDMIKKGKQGKLPDVQRLGIYCKACGLDPEQTEQWVKVLDTLKTAQLESAQAARQADLTDSSQSVAPPSNKLSRALRQLVGVDEDLLAQVPQERVRYTIFGATVVTAVLLGASGAAVAFTQLSWGSTWANALITTLAGVVFGLFDLLLITSVIRNTNGLLSRRRRFWVLLPKIGLAVLTSLLIAESVLLAVFNPEIHQKALATRSHQFALYETTLRNCNPVGPTTTITRNCAAYSVTSTAAAALQAQLTPLNQQRASLQAQIGAAKNRISAAEEVAQLECSGAAGTGLSGMVGAGPNCFRDRQIAAQVRVDVNLDRLQGQLVDLDGTLVNVSGNLSRYISQAINQKISAQRAHLQDQVGILEQEQALGAIHNNFVWSAEWVVRIAIIVIALLPLILSVAIAGTEYEKLMRTARTSAIASARATRRKGTTENLQAIAALAKQIIEHLDRLPQPVAEQAQTDLDAMHDGLLAIRAQIGELADRDRSSQVRKKPK